MPNVYAVCNMFALTATFIELLTVSKWTLCILLYTMMMHAKEF
jgi:hypothetical protein